MVQNKLDQAVKIDVLSVQFRAVVALNLTADDWQFYDLAGREQAAESLNRETERLLAEGAAPARLRALLSRWAYSQFGAADTEGHMMLEQILRAVGAVRYDLARY